MLPPLAFTRLFVLVYAGESIKYGFLLLYMQETLRIEPAVRGAVIGIQPLIELLIMPFSVVVARRVGILWLMCIGAALGLGANLCFALWGDVGAVTAELVLGFIVALALFNITKGRRLANAIILLPMIITPVITALLWRYLLDPQFGIVAQVMTLLGAKGGIEVWGSSTLALPGLALVDIWQWTPFVILVFHAGMLGISNELFEAAAIDGARQIRVAWSVILPSILPQVLLVLLFRTMDTYRIFDIVFVLTRGGPGMASDTIGLFTYRTGFTYTEMGYAMALSLFILITVAIISSVYIRLPKRQGAA